MNIPERKLFGLNSFDMIKTMIYLNLDSKTGIFIILPRWFAAAEAERAVEERVAEKDAADESALSTGKPRRGTDSYAQQTRHIYNENIDFLLV
ncbi:hypothetical protein CEXT_531221 [Caerostris extrusa]|uniref:Uncharacterized protein n=1 Tax=Caerostris extrusa TaxID=172846 RepID=A0AAV4NA46_CAEEX|nr:hypothetical protein CEXT_531221 [Caerostris extrusa]